jgi:two-component system sensor histidine kinase BaeS
MAMIRSLRVKFIVLLLAVSAIALSSTFLLRELMLNDFRQYLEGEREDRVYWVTADLERSFERLHRWDSGALAGETVRALLLGFEARIMDDGGRTIMDTGTALGSLSPSMRQRVEALNERHRASESSPFYPYPLYLEGRQIGTLEVRFLEPRRDVLFIVQSGRFLLWSIAALGGVALLLSIVAAGVLTRSLRRLSAAVAAVGSGDLAVRVPVRGGDEIAGLSQGFNRMAQALALQEELRKKLITNLAHELRTPLSAMRGELEGMMDGVIPQNRGQIESLHEETGRLQRMIEGIEELARAQASSLTLRKERFLLRTFLEGILGRITRQAQEKGVLLDLDCPPSVEADADPERLSQVVLNLLSNALRATEGGGKITVHASSADGQTMIQVVDTGRGIDPRDLPFVFERFFRSPEGGLGLGLAIAKELVEAHNGSIRAESIPGRGSVFTLLLPQPGLHNPS